MLTCGEITPQFTFPPFALVRQAYDNHAVSMKLLHNCGCTNLFSIFPDSKVGRMPIRYLTTNATVNVLIKPRVQFCVHVFPSWRHKLGLVFSAAVISRLSLFRLWLCMQRGSEMRRPWSSVASIPLTCSDASIFLETSESRI